jgi:hypothetical protein
MSPSSHIGGSASASAAASAKAAIVLPSDKEAGRMVISPGRDKKDSDFARRLKLSEDSFDGSSSAGAGDGGECKQMGQEQRRLPRRAAAAAAAAAEASSSSSSGSSSSSSSSSTAVSTTRDEWKAASTSAGRTYYYNRRTRVSAWKLPEGATLVESSASATTGSSSSSSSSSPIKQQPYSSSSLGSSGTYSTHAPARVAPLPLYCMFCGAHPAGGDGEDVSLAAHMQECTSCDLTNRDVVEAVCALAAAIGIVQPAFNSAVSVGGKGTSSSRQQQQQQPLGGNDNPQYQQNQLAASRASSSVASSTAKYTEDSFDSFTDMTMTSREQQEEQCEYCARTFAAGRLVHHEPSCREAHSFRKVPFDAARKRQAGTAMELFMPKSPSSLPKPPTPTSGGSRPSSRK